MKFSIPGRRSGSTRGLALAIAAGTAMLAATGCRDQEPSSQVVEEGAALVESAGEPRLVDWVVFENANSSLKEAERHLIEMESREASVALARAADHFTRMAEGAGAEDARRLRASAQELKTLATDFPDDIVTHRKVLGEVEGRALIALARHHLLAVERLVADGEGAEAGRHLLSAANDVAEGFRVSDLLMTGPSAADLDAGRKAAEGWMNGVAVDSAVAGTARRAVRDEAERLANALGALHR